MIGWIYALLQGMTRVTFIKQHSTTAEGFFMEVFFFKHVSTYTIQGTSPGFTSEEMIIDSLIFFGLTFPNEDNYLPFPSGFLMITSVSFTQALEGPY